MLKRTLTTKVIASTLVAALVLTMPGMSGWAGTQDTVPSPRKQTTSQSKNSTASTPLIVEAKTAPGKNWVNVVDPKVGKMTELQLLDGAMNVAKMFAGFVPGLPRAEMDYFAANTHKVDRVSVGGTEFNNAGAQVISADSLSGRMIQLSQDLIGDPTVRNNSLTAMQQNQQRSAQFTNAQMIASQINDAAEDQSESERVISDGGRAVRQTQSRSVRSGASASEPVSNPDGVNGLFQFFDSMVGDENLTDADWKKRIDDAPTANQKNILQMLRQYGGSQGSIQKNIDDANKDIVDGLVHVSALNDQIGDISGRIRVAKNTIKVKQDEYNKLEKEWLEHRSKQEETLSGWWHSMRMSQLETEMAATKDAIEQTKMSLNGNENALRHEEKVGYLMLRQELEDQRAKDKEVIAAAKKFKNEEKEMLQKYLPEKVSGFHFEEYPDQDEYQGREWVHPKGAETGYWKDKKLTKTVYRRSLDQAVQEKIANRTVRRDFKQVDNAHTWAMVGMALGFALAIGIIIATGGLGAPVAAYAASAGLGAGATTLALGAASLIQGTLVIGSTIGGGMLGSMMDRAAHNERENEAVTGQFKNARQVAGVAQLDKNIAEVEAWHEKNVATRRQARLDAYKKGTFVERGKQFAQAQNLAVAKRKELANLWQDLRGIGGASDGAARLAKIIAAHEGKTIPLNLKNKSLEQAAREYMAYAGAQAATVALKSFDQGIKEWKKFDEQMGKLDRNVMFSGVAVKAIPEYIYTQATGKRFNFAGNYDGKLQDADGNPVTFMRAGGEALNPAALLYSQARGDIQMFDANYGTVLPPSEFMQYQRQTIKNPDLPHYGNSYSDYSNRLRNSYASLHFQIENNVDWVNKYANPNDTFGYGYQWLKGVFGGALSGVQATAIEPWRILNNGVGWTVGRFFKGQDYAVPSAAALGNTTLFRMLGETPLSEVQKLYPTFDSFDGHANDYRFFFSYDRQGKAHSNTGVDYLDQLIMSNRTQMMGHDKTLFLANGAEILERVDLNSNSKAMYTRAFAKWSSDEDGAGRDLAIAFGGTVLENAGTMFGLGKLAGGLKYLRTADVIGTSAYYGARIATVDLAAMQFGYQILDAGKEIYAGWQAQKAGEYEVANLHFGGGLAELSGVIGGSLAIRLPGIGRMALGGRAESTWGEAWDAFQSRGAERGWVSTTGRSIGSYIWNVGEATVGEIGKFTAQALAISFGGSAAGEAGSVLGAMGTHFIPEAKTVLDRFGKIVSEQFNIALQSTTGTGISADAIKFLKAEAAQDFFGRLMKYMPSETLEKIIDGVAGPKGDGLLDIKPDIVAFRWSTGMDSRWEVDSSKNIYLRNAAKIELGERERRADANNNRRGPSDWLNNVMNEVGKYFPIGAPAMVPAMAGAGASDSRFARTDVVSESAWEGTGGRGGGSERSSAAEAEAKKQFADTLTQLRADADAAYRAAIANPGDVKLAKAWEKAADKLVAVEADVRALRTLEMAGSDFNVLDTVEAHEAMGQELANQAQKEAVAELQKLAAKARIERLTLEEKAQGDESKLSLEERQQLAQSRADEATHLAEIAKHLADQAYLMAAPNADDKNREAQKASVVMGDANAALAKAKADVHDSKAAKAKKELNDMVEDAKAKHIQTDPETIAKIQAKEAEVERLERAARLQRAARTVFEKQARLVEHQMDAGFLQRMGIRGDLGNAETALQKANTEFDNVKKENQRPLELRQTNNLRLEASNEQLGALRGKAETAAEIQGKKNAFDRLIAKLDQIRADDQPGNTHDLQTWHEAERQVALDQARRVAQGHAEWTPQEFHTQVEIKALALHEGRITERVSNAEATRQLKQIQLDSQGLKGKVEDIKRNDTSDKSQDVRNWHEAERQVAVERAQRVADGKSDWSPEEITRRVQEKAQGIAEGRITERISNEEAASKVDSLIDSVAKVRKSAQADLSLIDARENLAKTHDPSAREALEKDVELKKTDADLARQDVRIDRQTKSTAEVEAKEDAAIDLRDRLRKQDRRKDADPNIKNWHDAETEVIAEELARLDRGETLRENLDDLIRQRADELGLGKTTADANARDAADQLVTKIQAEADIARAKLAHETQESQRLQASKRVTESTDWLSRRKNQSDLEIENLKSQRTSDRVTRLENLREGEEKLKDIKSRREAIADLKSEIQTLHEQMGSREELLRIAESDGHQDLARARDWLEAKITVLSERAADIYLGRPPLNAEQTQTTIRTRAQAAYEARLARESRIPTGFAAGPRSIREEIAELRKNKIPERGPKAKAEFDAIESEINRMLSERPDHARERREKEAREQGHSDIERLADWESGKMEVLRQQAAAVADGKEALTGEALETAIKKQAEQIYQQRIARLEVDLQNAMERIGTVDAMIGQHLSVAEARVEALRSASQGFSNLRGVDLSWSMRLKRVAVVAFASIGLFKSATTVQEAQGATITLGLNRAEARTAHDANLGFRQEVANEFARRKAEKTASASGVNGELKTVKVEKLSEEQRAQRLEAVQDLLRESLTSEHVRFDVAPGAEGALRRYNELMHEKQHRELTDAEKAELKAAKDALNGKINIDVSPEFVRELRALMHPDIVNEVMDLIFGTQGSEGVPGKKGLLEVFLKQLNPLLEFQWNSLQSGENVDRMIKDGMHIQAAVSGGKTLLTIRAMITHMLIEPENGASLALLRSKTAMKGYDNDPINLFVVKLFGMRFENIDGLAAKAQEAAAGTAEYRERWLEVFRALERRDNLNLATWVEITQLINEAMESQDPVVRRAIQEFVARGDTRLLLRIIDEAHEYLGEDTQGIRGDGGRALIEVLKERESDYRDLWRKVNDALYGDHAFVSKNADEGQFQWHRKGSGIELTPELKAMFSENGKFSANDIKSALEAALSDPRRNSGADPYAELNISENGILAPSSALSGLQEKRIVQNEQKLVFMAFLMDELATANGTRKVNWSDTKTGGTTLAASGLLDILTFFGRGEVSFLSGTLGHLAPVIRALTGREIHTHGVIPSLKLVYKDGEPQGIEIFSPGQQSITLNYEISKTKAEDMQARLNKSADIFIQRLSAERDAGDPSKVDGFGQWIHLKSVDRDAAEFKEGIAKALVEKATQDAQIRDLLLKEAELPADATLTLETARKIVNKRWVRIDANTVLDENAVDGARKQASKKGLLVAVGDVGAVGVSVLGDRNSVIANAVELNGKTLMEQLIARINRQKEGGAFFKDGEATLFTSEEALKERLDVLVKRYGKEVELMWRDEPDLLKLLHDYNNPNGKELHPEAKLFLVLKLNEMVQISQDVNKAADRIVDKAVVEDPMRDWLNYLESQKGTDTEVYRAAKELYQQKILKKNSDLYEEFAVDGITDAGRVLRSKYSNAVSRVEKLEEYVKGNRKLKGELKSFRRIFDVDGLKSALKAYDAIDADVNTSLRQLYEQGGSKAKGVVSIIKTFEPYMFSDYATTSYMPKSVSLMRTAAIKIQNGGELSAGDIRHIQNAARRDVQVFKELRLSPPGKVLAVAHARNDATVKNLAALNVAPWDHGVPRLAKMSVGGWKATYQEAYRDSRKKMEGSVTASVMRGVGAVVQQEFRASLPEQQSAASSAQAFADITIQLEQLPNTPANAGRRVELQLLQNLLLNDLNELVGNPNSTVTSNFLKSRSSIVADVRKRAGREAANRVNKELERLETSARTRDKDVVGRRGGFRSDVSGKGGKADRIATVDLGDANAVEELHGRIEFAKANGHRLFVVLENNPNESVTKQADRRAAVESALARAHEQGADVRLVDEHGQAHQLEFIDPPLIGTFSRAESARMVVPAGTVEAGRHRTLTLGNSSRVINRENPHRVSLPVTRRTRIIAGSAVATPTKNKAIRAHIRTWQRNLPWNRVGNPNKMPKDAYLEQSGEHQQLLQQVGGLRRQIQALQKQQASIRENDEAKRKAIGEKIQELSGQMKDRQAKLKPLNAKYRETAKQMVVAAKSIAPAIDAGLSEAGTLQQAEFLRALSAVDENAEGVIAEVEAIVNRFSDLMASERERIVKEELPDVLQEPKVKTAIRNDKPIATATVDLESQTLPGLFATRMRDRLPEYTRYLSPQEYDAFKARFDEALGMIEALEQNSEKHRYWKDLTISQKMKKIDSIMEGFYQKVHPDDTVRWLFAEDVQSTLKELVPDGRDIDAQVVMRQGVIDALRGVAKSPQELFLLVDSGNEDAVRQILADLKPQAAALGLVIPTLCLVVSKDRYETMESRKNEQRKIAQDELFNLGRWEQRASFAERHPFAMRGIVLLVSTVIALLVAWVVIGGTALVAVFTAGTAAVKGGGVLAMVKGATATVTGFPTAALTWFQTIPCIVEGATGFWGVLIALADFVLPWKVMLAGAALPALQGVVRRLMGLPSEGPGFRERARAMQNQGVKDMMKSSMSSSGMKFMMLYNLLLGSWLSMAGIMFFMPILEFLRELVWNHAPDAFKSGLRSVRSGIGRAVGHAMPHARALLGWTARMARVVTLTLVSFHNEHPILTRWFMVPVVSMGVIGAAVFVGVHGFWMAILLFVVALGLYLFYKTEPTSLKIAQPNNVFRAKPMGDAPPDDAAPEQYHRVTVHFNPPPGVPMEQFEQYEIRWRAVGQSRGGVLAWKRGPDGRLIPEADITVFGGEEMRFYVQPVRGPKVKTTPVVQVTGKGKDRKQVPVTRAAKDGRQVQVVQQQSLGRDWLRVTPIHPMSRVSVRRDPNPAMPGVFVKAHGITPEEIQRTVQAVQQGMVISQAATPLATPIASQNNGTAALSASGRTTTAGTAVMGNQLNTSGTTPVGATLRTTNTRTPATHENNLTVNFIPDDAMVGNVTPEGNYEEYGDYVLTYFVPGHPETRREVPMSRDTSEANKSYVGSLQTPNEKVVYRASIYIPRGSEYVFEVRAVKKTYKNGEPNDYSTQVYNIYPWNAVRMRRLRFSGTAAGTAVANTDPNTTQMTYIAAAPAPFVPQAAPAQVGPAGTLRTTAPSGTLPGTGFSSPSAAPRTTFGTGAGTFSGGQWQVTGQAGGQSGGTSSTGHTGFSAGFNNGGTPVAPPIGVPQTPVVPPVGSHGTPVSPVIPPANNVPPTPATPQGATPQTPVAGIPVAESQTPVVGIPVAESQTPVAPVVASGNTQAQATSDSVEELLPETETPVTAPTAYRIGSYVVLGIFAIVAIGSVAFFSVTAAAVLTIAFSLYLMRSQLDQMLTWLSDGRRGTILGRIVVWGPFAVGVTALTFWAWPLALMIVAIVALALYRQPIYRALKWVVNGVLRGPQAKLVRTVLLGVGSAILLIHYAPNASVAIGQSMHDHWLAWLIVIGSSAVFLFRGLWLAPITVRIKNYRQAKDETRRREEDVRRRNEELVAEARESLKPKASFNFELKPDLRIQQDANDPGKPIDEIYTGLRIRIYRPGQDPIRHGKLLEIKRLTAFDENGFGKYMYVASSDAFPEGTEYVAELVLYGITLDGSGVRASLPLEKALVSARAYYSKDAAPLTISKAPETALPGAIKVMATPKAVPTNVIEMPTPAPKTKHTDKVVNWVLVASLTGLVLTLGVAVFAYGGWAGLTLTVPRALMLFGVPAGQVIPSVLGLIVAIGLVATFAVRALTPVRTATSSENRRNFGAKRASRFA